jgi:hypothetical protein
MWPTTMLPPTALLPPPTIMKLIDDVSLLYQLTTLTMMTSC